MVIMVSSCVDDVSHEAVNQVQNYFQLFESEAYARGVDLDLEQMNVTAQVEQIEQGNVVGQCKTYSDGSKEIVLDLVYWENATEIEREYLVFHELGHCVLERDHNNERDDNGICISIMQSGTGGCNKRYNELSREVLIDELFE